MSAMLSREELATWTGYKVPSKQIGWLKANRHTFSINAGGHPVVSRSYFERVMGGSVTAVAQHNFEALR
jgi:hypothetical protein